MRPTREQLEALETFNEEMVSRLAKIMPLAGEAFRNTTNRPDMGLVNALFREIHSLKGASSVVGIKEIADSAHSIEDLLAGVRDDGKCLAEEEREFFFQGLSRLNKLNVQLTNRIDSGFWGF